MEIKIKKPLLSAFAMSLFFASLGVSGEELELLPELIGSQEFSSPELHQNPEWKVSVKEVEEDKEPLKGQSHSLIPWSGLDTEAWLDIDKWIIERDIKDKNPDWKLRLRDESQLELMGKVLSCSGECYSYRGASGVNVQHLSRLVEGDEFQTGKNSVAWIYLMDGTLIRISPESSISFQEINFTESEAFYLMRLNAGHIFWHPRDKKDFPVELAPETATLNLPLMVRNANEEFYERIIYQKNNESHLADFLSVEDQAVALQIQELNSFRAQNNKIMKLSSKVMMVAPNVTLISSQTSFDLVYIPGGKAFFKMRGEMDLGKEFSLELRGYAQTRPVFIQDSLWHTVAPSGRSYEVENDPAKELQLLELLTKRIKSFELAREMWVAEYSVPVVMSLSEPKLLATQFGYSLWGDELKKRQHFLSEYTRRIETTNLRSLDNLLNKLEKNGEIIKREISSIYYETPLNDYLRELKTRYNDKEIQVREMNELQYYVWILKNGRLQN
jgi:hypothetical protein